MGRDQREVSEHIIRSFVRDSLPFLRSSGAGPRNGIHGEIDVDYLDSSMHYLKDKTAKLWDIETGKEFATLKGHSGEIVSLNFNADGDKLLTGSFDSTAMVILD